jgi:amidohydrolase
MHACGHDGHTAILLTVAGVLSELKGQLDGEVLFVFQPAEEIGIGAPAMLEDGALDGRKPDAVYGLHLWSSLPAGQIGVRDGPLFANTDQFELTIKGSGGHGAMPHQAVDPIVVAAQVVLALQTLVSRETAPLEPSVLTVGSIHGGTAFNIIPPEVQLVGTVRTFTDELQAQMEQRIEALAAGVTRGMRAEYAYRYTRCCPAVVNDPGGSQLAREVAAELYGAERVVLPSQTMGGDDMSYFLREGPGSYLLVGAGRPDGRSAPHHHPRFDLDESSLPVGAELLAELAVRVLQE